MVRQRSRRDEITRWLSQRDAEHLSFAQLSQRSGIPVGTLASWAHRLRAEGNAADFVEVRVRDDMTELDRTRPRGSATSSARVHLPSGVEITLRGEAAFRITEALIEALPQW